MKSKEKGKYKHKPNKNRHSYKKHNCNKRNGIDLDI